MKILKLVMIFFVAIILMYCSKEDNLSDNKSNELVKKYSAKENSKLDDIIILKDIKEKFSVLSLDLGITKIKAEKKDNKYYFRITRNINSINNLNVDDLNELVIFEENDMIITKFAKSKNYIASRSHLGKEPLIFFNDKLTEYKSGDFNKLNPKQQLEFTNLIVIRDEIINPDLELFSPIVVSAAEKTCNWISVQVESDREFAKYELEKATVSFLKDHPDCKKAGGISSGCLWEDFGCIATQRFECNGKTCDYL